MWKSIISAAIAAFLVSALVGVFAGTIPLFNPQQLQIPATGADLNALINLVNSNAVIGGPGGNSGSVGGASGAFSVNPVGGSPNVNGLQVIGGGTGVSPILAAVGSDANVGLALDPQGSGLVQFIGPTQWQSAPTLTPCPGAGRASAQTPNQLTLGAGPVYNQLLLVKDNLGNVVALPGCLVANASSGL